MTSDFALSIRGLRKAFGDHVVLDGIDLDVSSGTVLALLGANGAGKTTTVNVCSTLLRADAGEVRVLGHDVQTAVSAVRRAIGVTGQFSAIDELLSGRENLRMMADLAHLDRASVPAVVEEMLERLDLVAAGDRRAQTYSGGMKRRLDLAMTLIVRPRLIFLDEPTTGLDPRSRRGLWAIVRELVADGVSVLLTTQYLEEADALADRVAVLDGGRIVAEGTPGELKRRAPGGHVDVRFEDHEALAAAAAAHPTATMDRDKLTLRVPNDGLPGLRRLLEELEDQSVADLTVATADLDDVFLALTGRKAADTDELEAVR